MHGLYPEETIPFDLPIHRSIEASKRPRFRQRFITGRQRVIIDAIIDEAAKLEGKGNAGGALDKLEEALKLTLAGWENITDADGHKIDFDVSKLGDLLDYEDQWALYSEGMAALRVRRETIKKSVSPSPSPAETSAPPAS